MEFSPSPTPSPTPTSNVSNTCQYAVGQCVRASVGCGPNQHEATQADANNANGFKYPTCGNNNRTVICCVNNVNTCTIGGSGTPGGIAAPFCQPKSQPCPVYTHVANGNDNNGYTRGKGGLACDYDGQQQCCVPNALSQINTCQVSGGTCAQASSTCPIGTHEALDTDTNEFTGGTGDLTCGVSLKQAMCCMPNTKAPAGYTPSACQTLGGTCTSYSACDSSTSKPASSVSCGSTSGAVCCLPVSNGAVAPMGAVDQNMSCTITGWACVKGSNTIVQVGIYADVPWYQDAPSYSHYFGGFYANQDFGAGDRAAINAAQYCNTNSSIPRRFSAVVPSKFRDGITHKVYVYGIGGGNNPLLWNAPSTFTCAATNVGGGRSGGLR